MGNCCSNVSSVQLELSAASWRKWGREFQQIHMTKDAIALLFDPYSSICKKAGAGMDGIDIDYIVKAIGFPDNNYLEKIFSVFAVEGKVNFKQFVFALWLFCSTPSADDALAYLSFDLYHGGVKSCCDFALVQTIIENIYKEKAVHFDDDYKIVYDGILHKMDIFDKSISHDKWAVKDFAQFCQVHPMALSPLQKLHDKIMTRFIGVPFWNGVSKQRMYNCEGQYTPIHIVLERYQKEQAVDARFELNAKNEAPKSRKRTHSGDDLDDPVGEHEKHKKSEKRHHGSAVVSPSNDADGNMSENNDNGCDADRGSPSQGESVKRPTQCHNNENHPNVHQVDFTPVHPKRNSGTSNSSRHSPVSHKDQLKAAKEAITVEASEYHHAMEGFPIADFDTHTHDGHKHSSEAARAAAEAAADIAERATQRNVTGSRKSNVPVLKRNTIA